MVSIGQTGALRSLPEAPPLLFSDSVPLNIHPAILSCLRSLETRLKHVWSDSRILLMEIQDKRLYLALCTAHRHLLQSTLEFTLFPTRIGTREDNFRYGSILGSEREVRKFARRIWQYLERIRCFLGDYNRFDEVDVRLLLDEAVKCTQLTIALHISYAEKSSTIGPETVDLGEVARGRFLLRLHESLQKKSFSRDSVFLMEEAQIRACIADVKNLLSPTSITRHKRHEGGRSGNQSGLWTWLMKKTAFLTMNDSNSSIDGAQRRLDDALRQHSSHSGSRESRLFGASDSSELIQSLPMSREKDKEVIRTVEVEEVSPHVGIPEISASTKPDSPVIVASRRMDFVERELSPPRSPMNIVFPNDSGTASPQVEARIVTSGRLNIPSPILDPRINSTTMTNDVLLSPKGKSPLNSPLHSPTKQQEDFLPFHPLILNTFKTTTRPLNCSSSTADFILKNSTSTVAFQFKNGNNDVSSNTGNGTPGNSPVNQPMTTSKLIKSTSAHSLAKSQNKHKATSPPRSPTTPTEAPNILPTNQNVINLNSPRTTNSGFVTDYSPGATSKFAPFNMQVSASSAINETELELLTATQASAGFRCAMCGIKLSSNSYRHMEGNRRACRKPCLGATTPTESENAKNMNLEEERSLSDAITESIRKTCYT